MVEPSEHGDWVKQSTLGTGGFGTVVLWKNKISGKSLALKKCRWGNDPMLTDKHKERWRLEVLIMNKLQHPNIVTAVHVPEELNVLPTEMPVLAMEYCLRGDLRKVLNLPENCCGLPEATVRNVIRDISSAVDYLHSMRIIHRDLKPENVVLQDVNGKTAYKLIDLGYAKELDQGSICTSFVGTLQYLAPELFMSQEYTCTVDYWSLGLVTHECAVGLRPFLPNLAPAEWMKYVCKKKSTDICVYMTQDGSIKCSPELFQENNLSTPLVRHLESWLRVMLEWNPQKRGIEISSDGKQIIAFSMLQDILKKQVLHFFFVPAGKLFSYELHGDEVTQEIVEMLVRDTGCTIEEIECLDPRGVPMLMNKLAEKYCAPPEDEEEWLMYVFNKSDLDLAHIHRRNIPLVDQMLADKNKLVIYEEQRKLWSHAIYFVHQETMLQRRLLQAYKILVYRLVYCNSQMMRSLNGMTLELNKLLAQLELSKKCLNADKEEYEMSRKYGITSRQMEGHLRLTSIEWSIEVLQSKVAEYDSAATRVNTKTVGLQQSFRVQGQPMSPMDELYKRSLDVYSELRRKDKEQRRIPCDNGPMFSVLIDCLRNRDAWLKKTLTNLQRVQDCKKEVLKVASPFEDDTKSIKSLADELAEAQVSRQKILWTAFRKAVQKQQENSLPMENRAKSKCNIPPNKLSRSSASPPGAESLSLKGTSDGFSYKTMMDTPSLNQMSLSGIMIKSTEESINAIRQNQHLRSKLFEKFDALCIEESDELDWSYLDSVKSSK